MFIDIYKDDPLHDFLTYTHCAKIDMLLVTRLYDQWLKWTKYWHNPPMLLRVLVKNVISRNSMSNKVTCHVSDMNFWEALGETHNGLIASPNNQFLKVLASKGEGPLKLNPMHYKPYDTPSWFNPQSLSIFL